MTMDFEARRVDGAMAPARGTFAAVRSTTKSSRTIRAPGGRKLVASPVFDTYWRFAFERQSLFMRRVDGHSPPWTADPIIAGHRFTNAYRASDRVSQYLIRHVLYEGKTSAAEVFFRAMLFKIFNRIDTWERLKAAVGTPSWAEYKRTRYERALDRMMGAGDRVYSAAYIMPSPAFGAARKHANHLRLIEHMMNDGAPDKIRRARSLSQVYETLLGYPSLGGFLAFQLTIDLNYSEMIDFSEMDFVVAGPGARDGIRKCFLDTGGLDESDVIRVTAERAEEEFSRQGLAFPTLWGRPLQLIDCQNLFCEVDKYARVAHPEASGDSGRTRIKQKYAPTNRPVPQWYPPKWGLKPDVPAVPGAPQSGIRQQSLF